MMIFDEEKYAFDLYCGRNAEIKTIFAKIKYVTRYQHFCLNYDDEENYKKTVDWMYKNHPDFQEYMYSNLISDMVRRAHNKPFYKIDFIEISKNEIDKIYSIKDIKLEKLLFVLLCETKLQEKISNFTNGLVVYNINELFKEARVTVKSSERELLIGKLVEMGFVDIPKKNDTNCLSVKIIENGETAIKLNETDCLELAYYYLNMKNHGGYQHCEKCGRLFRKAKNRKYCLECSKYETENNKIVECCDCHKLFLTSAKSTVINRCPECQYKEHYDVMDTKIVKCIDCGKEFEVSSKDTMTIRCPECYSLYRRNKIKENVRKFRLKNM